MHAHGWRVFIVASVGDEGGAADADKIVDMSHSHDVAGRRVREDWGTRIIDSGPKLFFSRRLIFVAGVVPMG